MLFSSGLQVAIEVVIFDYIFMYEEDDAVNVDVVDVHVVDVYDVLYQLI